MYLLRRAQELLAHPHMGVKQTLNFRTPARVHWVGPSVLRSMWVPALRTSGSALWTWHLVAQTTRSERRNQTLRAACVLGWDWVGLVQHHGDPEEENHPCFLGSFICNGLGVPDFDPHLVLGWVSPCIAHLFSPWTYGWCMSTSPLLLLDQLDFFKTPMMYDLGH